MGITYGFTDNLEFSVFPSFVLGMFCSKGLAYRSLVTKKCVSLTGLWELHVGSLKLSLSLEAQFFLSSQCFETLSRKKQLLCSFPVSLHKPYITHIQHKAAGSGEFPDVQLMLQQA